MTPDQFKDSRKFAVTPAHATGVASALAGFEATMSLVDNIDPAFTAHDTTIAVPRAQRLQRVSNFHNETGQRQAVQFEGWTLNPVETGKSHRTEQVF